MLDDTHGYFVIGGGKFIRGIEGYHGPATYYRIQGLPADQVGYRIYIYAYGELFLKVTYIAYNYNRLCIPLESNPWFWHCSISVVSNPTPGELPS